MILSYNQHYVIKYASYLVSDIYDRGCDSWLYRAIEPTKDLTISHLVDVFPFLQYDPLDVDIYVLLRRIMHLHSRKVKHFHISDIATDTFKHIDLLTLIHHGFIAYGDSTVNEISGNNHKLEFVSTDLFMINYVKHMSEFCMRSQFYSQELVSFERLEMYTSIISMRLDTKVLNTLPIPFANEIDRAIRIIESVYKDTSLTLNIGEVAALFPFYSLSECSIMLQLILTLRGTTTTITLNDLGLNKYPGEKYRIITKCMYNGYITLIKPDDREFHPTKEYLWGDRNNFRKNYAYDMCRYYLSRQMLDRGPITFDERLMR